MEKADNQVFHQTDGQANGNQIHDNSETKNAEEMPLTEPPRSSPPQMDSGFTAWIQCLSCSCLWFATWGIANSFGVFQTYYEQRFPAQSASSISWIGSLQLALLISLGIIIGPIYDAGYLRIVILTGCFISVLAMMLTSLCTQYWQILLTQGFLLGIGNGFLYIPSFAILPSYFAKRRALAIGLAAAGSALGGVVFPIVFHKLQPSIGFPWTMRVFGFIMLFIFTIPVAAMRMRTKPPAIRRMFDVVAWRELPFFLTGCGMFFLYMGMYVPMFYLQSYALDKGVIDSTILFYLLPLLNAGSFFGRIIPPHLADKLGLYNIIITSIIVTSLLDFAWISINNTTGIVVFAIIYGFFSGSVAGLAAGTVVSVTPNLNQLGGRLGMIMIPYSLGSLFGNPIAGALQANNWVSLQVFAGAMQAMAAASFMGSRLLLYGSKWDKK